MSVFDALVLHCPECTDNGELCASCCFFLLTSVCVSRDKLQPRSRVTLRDLQTKSNASSRPAPNATTHSAGPALAAGPPSAVPPEQPATLLPSALSLAAAERASLGATDPSDNISLSDVTVPLEAIRPSKHGQHHQAQPGR